MEFKFITYLIAEEGTRKVHIKTCFTAVYKVVLF